MQDLALPLLTISETGYVEEPHKNKYGQDYPPAHGHGPQLSGHQKMRNPFSRISLLWKIMLSTSVAITLLFAVTGWLAVKAATRATTQSINHEVQASFQAYQSLWKARADRLSSISSILSAMSDVRAAFRTGDEATIRDVAGELWSRVSDADAFFLVTNPRGEVIASLGGLSRESLPSELPVVREAFSHFPAQASGFLARGENSSITSQSPPSTSRPPAERRC